MSRNSPLNSIKQQSKLQTHCPLCSNSDVTFYWRDKNRHYLRCADCSLVFVPGQYHLGPERELERYRLHDNSVDNPGYVDYLRRFADVLGSIPIDFPRVLDFGSGEGCVLAKVLAKRSIVCESYDPLFGIGNDALSQKYDVVVLCEVAEHLRDIRAELSVVKKTLLPHGFVVIRTEPLPEGPEAFSDWWYIQDPTHINFYGKKAMLIVAGILGLRLRSIKGNNVYILGE